MQRVRCKGRFVSVGSQFVVNAWMNSPGTSRRDSTPSPRILRGGYHRTNTFDSRRLAGTKWTAMETTLGWRHFHAKEIKRLGKGHSIVLLEATCDSSVQYWVPVKASFLRHEIAPSHDIIPTTLLSLAHPGRSFAPLQTLRDRSSWASGWLQRTELAALADPPTRPCQRCSGTGQHACGRCAGSGEGAAIIEV